MYARIVDFFDLLLAALLVGVMFGIWLTNNPTGLDAAEYVAMQQRGIRALNVFMPLLGLATIVLTISAAIFARSDQLRLTTLVIAALCLVVAGVVTLFLNQPINAIVITWSPDAAPTEWTQLRDDWWRWHVVRLTFGIIALCLLILAALQRGTISQ